MCVFSVWLAVSAHAADPTAPEQHFSSTTVTPSVTALPVLELIRSQSQQYLAVLDGELVRAGQWHRGYLVTRIRAADVILQRGDEQWQLSLFGQYNQAGLLQTGHN